MEGICGVLQSTLVGPWISGIGTLVAAGTALFIYRKNRRNQLSDLADRRHVIHAMLREHVSAALEHFEHVDTLHRHLVHLGAKTLLRVLDLRNAERMFELQAKLAEFAEPRDVAIASFIERCREYKGDMEWFRRQHDREEKKVSPRKDDTEEGELSPPDWMGTPLDIEQRSRETLDRIIQYVQKNKSDISVG